MATSSKNIKFILPPTAPLRYKTASIPTSATVLDVLNKLTDLCHFVNFAECGYGLYLPKGNGTRGRWLEDDKPLTEYPMELFDDCVELRKKPGFRSNPNMPASTALPLKEGNAVRYSPLSRLWTPCLLRLYNVKLAICSSEHDNNPDVILFASVTKVEKSDKKYPFSQDTKTTFRCRNNAEMMEWVKVIGETVSLVNPDFMITMTDFSPPTSPRSPRTNRTMSFLSILSPREESSHSSTSGSTSPGTTGMPSGDVLHSSGSLSPRPGALSPREERKKYSFLTLRNTKKSKEKETTSPNLRSSKGAEKSQRDLLREAKEREKEREKEAKLRRKHSSTVSSTSPNSLSPNLTSSVSNPNSPTNPLSSPPIPPMDFPFLDGDDDLGIRARSHSTSTTTIPVIPTIQSLLTQKRISTNEAEILMLREKLNFQAEHSRQLEERYQKLLMKYTDQANKSTLSKSPSYREMEQAASGNALITSQSAPILEQEPAPQQQQKSSSMLWRWSSSRKSEPEVLELKLELQQLKAENRVMRLQLDRRADRDSKTVSSGKDRKRTSPKSRRQLRDGLEREKSLGRIEGRARRDSSVSPSTSENDLLGLTSSGGVRSRSSSMKEDGGEGGDVFLRDSIRSDYSTPRGELSSSMNRNDAPTPAKETSITSISALLHKSSSRNDMRRSVGVSDVEILQKEMSNLREKLIEQQQLFRREEGNRLNIEREYRKASQHDENSLVEMEGIARILQQSLGELKKTLEDEFTDFSDDSDAGESV